MIFKIAPSGKTMVGPRDVTELWAPQNKFASYGPESLLGSKYFSAYFAILLRLRLPQIASQLPLLLC